MTPGRSPAPYQSDLGLGCWNELSTVPGEDAARPVIQITHPYHPPRGRELAFVDSTHFWGLDRVFCERKDGWVQSIPPRWADFAVPDSLVRASAGRSALRVADLLELADFLARARSMAEETEEGAYS